MIEISRNLAAAERARWLGELSDALERAEELLATLALTRGHDATWMDLSARLAAARAEVRCLRLGSIEADLEQGPDWTELSPWKQAI